MKRILCYGDSNTWGYVPGSGRRFVYHLRWPGVLQGILGIQYCVIEAGLNGRTTGSQDPGTPGRNGVETLASLLDDYKPLNLVIVMLGTNDMKCVFDLTPKVIAEHAGTLITMIRNSNTGAALRAPKVLLLSPPAILSLPAASQPMFIGAIDKSKQLPGEYEAIAEYCGSHYFNAAAIVSGSQVDGVHLDKSAHRKLARALVEQVRLLCS